MGLGMPPALASRIGNNPASIAGVGTTQTGAAALTNGVVLLLTPTASNTAFILNSATSTGRPLYLWNASSSQGALIYPPTGGTINGGSVNASISIPTLTGAVVQLQNGSGVAAETWGAIVGTQGGATNPVFNTVTVVGELETGVNSATVTPIVMQSGPLNTTAVAGGLEYTVPGLYFSNAASSRGIVEVDQFIYAQAAITLVSQTGAQPAFVGASGGVLTNGEITLPVGTFEFECEFNLTALSATSGGFGFSLTAGSPAVIGQQSWEAYANKATLATPAAWQSSWNTGASTELATATTATVGFVRIHGTFTLTTAGPVIPNLSMTTAASAIVGVGSYFRVRPLGTQTVTFQGDWS